MIRVLAIDTASWFGSVALVESSSPGTASVVGEVGIRVRVSHTANLLRWIDWLFAECGWSRSDIDRICAVRGPGSFTGIRVGMGTACGLSLASGRPAVGVTTLDGLAEAIGPCESDRIVVLDAGRADLYGARYDAASKAARPIEGPWVGPRSQTLERIGPNGAVVVPGYGLDFGPIGPGVPARVARSPMWIAGAAGRIAADTTDLDDSALQMTPLYLRPSVVASAQQG